MAYVLGFICADGAVYRSSRGNYLSITSTDEAIVWAIKKAMGAEHPVKTLLSRGVYNRKTQFGLRIGCAAIYRDLSRLGVYPSKSLTLRLPNIPPEFLGSFTRGYFDGDGCVHLQRSAGKSKPIILRKLSVIFTSGSKLFLEGLLVALRKEIDLRQSKIYISHRSFQLRLNTGDSVSLFSLMYAETANTLFLKRKYMVFENYFRERAVRIDKAVQNALRW